MKLKTLLKKEITLEMVHENYIFVGLLIFSLFPIFNLIRSICGLTGYFTLWRDYIWILTGFSIYFELIIHISKKIPLFPKNKAAENPTLIIWVLLAVWIAISTFVTGPEYDSVIGTAKSHTGLICTCCYIYILFLSLDMKKTKQKYALVYTLLAVNTLVSVVSLVGYYLFNEKWNPVYQNLIFYNSNHISYYLLVGSAVSFTLMFFDTKKWFCLIPVFILQEWALLISDTLGCILAFLAMIPFTAVVLIITKRIKLGRLIILLGAAALVFAAANTLPTANGVRMDRKVASNVETLKESAAAAADIENARDSLGSGRMVLWKKAAECIIDSPVFGYGLGEMRRQLLSVSNNNTVHNEFLEYASNYGIPALLLYLLGIMGIYIRGLKNRKKISDLNILGVCVSFAYLCSSFFGVTMFYTAPYLFLFLGFAYFTGENSR